MGTQDRGIVFRLKMLFNPNCRCGMERGKMDKMQLLGSCICSISFGLPVTITVSTGVMASSGPVFWTEIMVAMASSFFSESRTMFHLGI